MSRQGVMAWLGGWMQRRRQAGWCDAMAAEAISPEQAKECRLVVQRRDDGHVVAAEAMRPVRGAARVMAPRLARG